jgi:hypothetical protein
MTAAVGPVAGTKFYVGTATGSPDTYVEVGDISSLGDISEAFANVTVSSIGSGDDFELKGTRNFPNFAIVMNRNDSDAGQQAFKAASAAVRGTLYWFKVLDVEGGTATWQGEVFGYGPAYGTTNQLRTVKTSVSIRPASLVITLSS